MIDRRRFALSACVLTLLPPALVRAAASYDPLATDPASDVRVVDDVVTDVTRGRRIPIRLYLPDATRPSAVVLFSHGLGGSREGSAYLGQHWARRGYVAVFLQHPGSDSSVWQDAAPGERRDTLVRAASLQSFFARVRDVGAVLDQLARWNADGSGALGGRLDLARVGMSGHSFGGVTTQAVSGQRFGDGRLSLTDRRIRAAIVMSPSLPRSGEEARSAFGAVAIPWLLMTGTRDVAAIGGQTVESRLSVYPALPAGGRYELVLDGAEHSAFTERALPGDALPRNPNHHRAILATSTAFWDAWLRDDADARRWLESGAVRAVLEPADRWQYK